MIFWPDTNNLGYSKTDFTFFQNWLFEDIGLLARITEYLFSRIASLAALGNLTCNQRFSLKVNQYYYREYICVHPLGRRPYSKTGVNYPRYLNCKQD